jgi:hypothetical protein
MELPELAERLVELDDLLLRNEISEDEYVELRVRLLSNYGGKESD